ncbi:MAG: NAD-dependent epimerase/dehydratase family protein, partial [Symploca sp. SIO2B6]|nr:NAD-dependent epimerase/dehydratase family protein [Symploca sp. SIO2B6]
VKLSGLNILVTGGAGFIGSHIVESLVQQDAKVIVYDNFSFGNRENLKAVEKDIEIIKADILDFDTLLKAMKGIDLVSHQAAQLEIFKSKQSPFEDLETNTIGTLNVLRAAQKNGVQKLINASSACIYGQVDGLTSESVYPRPNWEYGVSKLAAEKYCDIFNDYYGLPIVSLRYGIVYGEREWLRRVLSIFVKRTLQSQPLIVFGDGSQIRDFIYVGDLVEFHNQCLIQDVANGQSYNVGTGIGTTVKELAKIVVTASGKGLDIIYENTQEGEFSKLVPDKKRNSAELQVMLLDVEKAKADLQWTPKISLSEGLKREIQWASSNPHRWEKMVYTII